MFRRPVRVRRRLNRSTHYGMIRSLPGSPAGGSSEQLFVDSATGIFVNGITGVFVGMAVLYLAMKLIALVSAMGSGPDKTD